MIMDQPLNNHCHNKNLYNSVSADRGNFPVENFLKTA